MFEREIELVGGTVSTTTVALFALSAPCQLVARTGVTVYFQDPSGTAFSVQLVELTTPAQLERIVWAISVVAAYRLI